MNNCTTYPKMIWQYCRRKQQYFYTALLCVILYSFSFIPLPAPGIDHPTAIGPYLNGVFPDSAPNGANGNWVVENAFPHLTFADPLAFLEIPGENSYYVVGKTGQIWQVADDPGATVKKTVLDIGPMVDTDGDAGLLNAALHPEFGQAGSPNRGYIYVYYRHHPDGNVPDCETGGFLRLSRFTRTDGSEEFDPASELVMIQTYDEMCWHGGGAMFFDQEGYFYLATGDAGGINDDYQTTQRLNERFFGGLLRIDVDQDASRSHPIRRQQVDPAYRPFTDHSSYSQGYYIPNDNPWLDPAGSVLEEFYAIGLRSPHRASIDPLTGKIWVGDVGQGLREEISVISKGANLQWPFREGFLPGDLPVPNPLIGVSTPPVYDYGHGVGNSIIGGFVYRGDYYQGALNGQYLFGDHGVRNVWAYNPVNGEVSFLVNVPEWGSGEKNGISSFAVNSAGEIFILKLYGIDMDGGVVYRLKQGASVAEPPQLLSQTGVFADLATLTPAPGIVPYTVNAPLWSDRAAKKRWIALPNDGSHNSPDEQISFSAAGNWQFPAGTVFIKHFDLPVDYNTPAITQPLETRFLVITEDGGAYGVTYKWNEAGTDAELLVNGVSEDFPVTRPDGSPGIQTWDFPSRTDCMTCHNANADFVLGVHTWQLNGDMIYPSGITDNQLNTWRHLGMFANPFSPEQIPSLLKAANIHDESAPLGTRVRSYLDANCAHCHRPNGVEGAFDARFSTPLENQNILWTFGASRNTPEGHYVIKPKDISKSEIWIRDSNLGGNAMPPLGKGLLDEDYLDVLMEWISSLDEEACAEQPVGELKWVSAVSRNGEVEINRSIGSEKPNDGRPITINGREFALGLGVHAYSEIVYKTRGDYAVFQSYVGVDDEILECNAASVYFEVYADEELVYRSPMMRSGQDALLIKADIAGAEEVKLVVTGGEDGDGCDHADWADPRFLPCAECTPGGACNDGNACTINDAYDADCNCSGAAQDSDGDGVCDAEDQCPDFDDLLDTDGDGLPDGCDLCLEPAGAPCDDGNVCTTGDVYDANCNCAGAAQDSDGDGVCDAEDQCPGGDDTADADGDGLPDACDPCNEQAGAPCDDGNACTTGDVYNADCQCAGVFQDSDGDGVCDAKDQCPGFDDLKDLDADGVPDGCDDNINCESIYLTDLDWTGKPLNGYGPLRRDRSADGNTLTINGSTFERGLGGHAYSEVVYQLGGAYHTFYAYIGVDDETDCALGSVVFSVYTDGALAYTSPLIWFGQDALPVEVDVEGAGELKLVVTRGNDTDYCDHGNWADARLERCVAPCLPGAACDDGNECTVNDRYDAACGCAGTLADSDADGICDAEDQCPGFDDLLDVNANGVPDDCDACLIQAGQPCDDGDACTVGDRYDETCGCAGLPADEDGDGVCDAEDQCPGKDDAEDENNNGMPDGCEESNRASLMPIKPKLDILRTSIFAEAIIRFKLEQEERVGILLLDPLGALIDTVLADGMKAAGTHDIRLSPELQPGVYQVQLRYPDGVIQESLEIGSVNSAAFKPLQVKVHPNPFHNEFKLYISPPYPELKRAVIRIMDMNGRIIYQQYDAPFNEEITIRPHSGWTNGVYLMRIHASDYSFTYTIVKQ